MSFYLGLPNYQHISSKFRSSGTSSNFTIPLNNWSNSNKYDRVCLIKASIPKSYYLIDSRHNSFTILENSILRTITIPDGNYSFSSMRVTLLSLLNTGGVGYIYAISSNTSTGKYTFTVSNNAGYQPTITFVADCIANILGFSGIDSDPSSLIHQFSSDTLTSNQVVRFQLSNSILIYLDIVQPDNILAEINSAVPDNTEIAYVCPDVPSYSRPTKKMTSSSLRIKIVDSITYEELLLNGYDISLELIFYRNNNYHQYKMTKEYLSMVAEEAI